MKRTFHAKTLTLLISSLLVCLLVSWAQAQAKKTPTPTLQKKITMEDAIESRVGLNKVILKPGFEIVKKPNHAEVISLKATGANGQPTRVIVGEIDCQCTVVPGTNGGHCKYSVQGLTVTCEAFGGCNCKLAIVTKVTG